jgi:RND family efflux transporter MFP subunit
MLLREGAPSYGIAGFSIAAARPLRPALAAILFAVAAFACAPALGQGAPKGTEKGGKAESKADKTGKGRAGPPKDGARRGGGRPPTRVVVDVIKKRALQQTTPVIGRLVLREGGVIAARTAGAISEMKVHVGDVVRTGDVLARLVDDTVKAQLELARADLRLAEQELARVEDLRKRSSAAFQKARYEDAIQKVIRARSNMRIAELALSYMTIRAPFPGVITKRGTDTGAWVKTGDPVVTLINIESLEIEADVPADRTAGLNPGAKVMFTLRDGKPYVAAVRALVPEINPMTRTLAVRFVPTFPPGTAPRAANQAVTIAVPIGPKREIVSVHKDAVLERGGAQIVFVVIGGKALPRTVVLGEAFGTRFEVKAGLRPGELVVIRGNERLFPGQPVQPIRGS